MLKHLKIFYLLASALLVTGCAVALIGIGAVAVGTASYKNGNLIKTYQADYNRAVKASSDTLESFKIPLTDKISDELKTVLKAERPDGTPVEIAVVRIAQNLTEVGVRTGVVGVWDKRVSEQIQTSIGNKLSSSPQTVSGYTADTDKKQIHSEIKETKPYPQVAAIKESDETSVSNIPTDLSADHKNQMVVQKPPKIPSDFVIYFSEDTNALSEVAVEKLNSIAEVITNAPVKEVRVTGFSDSIGTAAFKKMISESRANSVKIYLIGKGIHPNMITSKGFGSDRPVASNKNEEGRRLNRRVEIELIYQ